METPKIFFRMRVKYTATGKDIENRRVMIANVSILFLVFSALLPKKKEPKASRISQLARIMPMQSSLPEKTIRSSLKRSIWATSPLNPIVNMATPRRFFIAIYR